MWQGSPTDWECACGGVVLGCQVETECRQSELSTAEREQALRLKSRAVELLPDGAANLAKLQVGPALRWGWEAGGWMGPACVTRSCHFPPPTPLHPTPLPPQLVVESSAQRVIHLAGQWEKHRVPLLAEYRHLRKLQDCREVGSRVRVGVDSPGLWVGAGSGPPEGPLQCSASLPSTHGALGSWNLLDGWQRSRSCTRVFGQLLKRPAGRRRSTSSW